MLSARSCFVRTKKGLLIILAIISVLAFIWPLSASIQKVYFCVVKYTNMHPHTLISVLTHIHTNKHFQIFLTGGEPLSLRKRHVELHMHIRRIMSQQEQWHWLSDTWYQQLLWGEQQSRDERICNLAVCHDLEQGDMVLISPSMNRKGLF